MLKIDNIGKLFTSTYRVAKHDHDLWEVVYYSSGQGSVQIGDEIESFNVGDVFIIPPQFIHSDWSKEGFQTIFFTFKHCTLSSKNFYRFSDNKNQAVLQILCQMYETFVSKNFNRENIINLYFDLFFQYMYSLSNVSAENYYVEYMRNVIINEMSNPYFSMDSIIKEIHLNPNYARDLFSKNVGCTPLQFLMDKRLDYAKQLIASRYLSHYSIREISYMCGFSDPYYFSRVFRKKVGVSPSEWERIINNNDISKSLE